jgi:hypothetical protein
MLENTEPRSIKLCNAFSQNCLGKLSMLIVIFLEAISPPSARRRRSQASASASRRAYRLPGSRERMSIDRDCGLAGHTFVERLFAGPVPGRQFHGRS